MTTAFEHPSALRVELCRDADVPALMAFIAAHWRAEHVLSHDAELLRWQFDPLRLRDRTATGPTVLLAWVDAQIVGMLGLTGFDLNLEGRRVPAAWLSQWFVAAGHRGHTGALRLVWAARRAGAEVLATVGANEVASSVLERLGLQRLPALSRWVGVFDVRGAAELAQAANPSMSSEAAQQLCRGHVVTPDASALPAGMDVVAWSAHAAAAWDRFWSERLAPTLVCACRDAAYLGWRYVRHPRFAYEVRFAERQADGAVVGVAVWRVERVRGTGTPVVRVVEFLASPEGVANLAHAVCEGARETNAALADFYCSSAAAAAPLAAAGWRLEAFAGPPFPSRLQPLEAGRHAIVPLVQLPPGESIVDRPLYITKSDGDQDRPN